jgi:hypothetical protein
MAGTVVHMAFAGLLAAALLGSVYDRRAVLVVLVVTALPDLDSFIALAVSGAHRATLHNFVVPAVAAAALWAEAARGDESVVLGRYGRRGVRVAWVAIVAYAAAGVGLDMVAGGVNPLYPLVDQFYVLDGKIELSDQRGIVQTFVETGGDSAVGIGSTDEISYSTGVDPDPSNTETDPERVFPVVRAGWQLVVLVVGTLVTLARFRLTHDLPEN